MPRFWKWLYLVDPIPKSFVAAMMSQVTCEEGATNAAVAPQGAPAASAASSRRIDGCRMISVPNEGEVQLYAYISRLLEGSHDS